MWSYAEGKLGTLQSETLEQLFCSKSLQSIHIEGFTLQDELLLSIAKSLRHNSTLQKLDLHVLKQAHEGTLALAESLRHNNQLQSLELFLSSNREHDPFLTTMANILMTNTALRVFKVHQYRRITPLEEEAFAGLLETNEALQVLDLNGYRGDARPKIDYFLRWNRRGRQHPMLKPLRVQVQNKQQSSNGQLAPSRQRNRKKKRSEVTIQDMSL
jgi:hypothetical protein